MSEAMLTRVRMEEETQTFDSYIQLYRRPLLNYLTRLLKDRVKAEDLVQETFMKFYKQITYRNTPENVPAWLYLVAANLCRDYWRKASFQREQSSLEFLPEQRDEKVQVIDVYVHKETRTEIVNLLENIPTKHREIIYLRFYKELKLKEISNALDCPMGTVKSRLFHALRFMKKEIEENGRVEDYEPYCFSC